MNGAGQSTAQLACVLAGGLSSRMGRDKALLPFRGRTLIEHAVDRLKRAGWQPVIAGSRPDLGRFAPVLADLHAGCGPLGGIETALSFAALSAGHADALATTVLFVPVDLPLLPVGFLALLRERAERTGAYATLARFEGRPQPLCAAYHTALLEGISAALEAGDSKVMRVVESLTGRGTRDLFRLEAVLAAQNHSLAPEQAMPARWFANINTPADLAWLAQLDKGWVPAVSSP